MQYQQLTGEVLHLFLQHYAALFSADHETIVHWLSSNNPELAGSANFPKLNDVDQEKLLQHIIA